MALLRHKAIYSFYYTNWKTNVKVYSFVMWSGGGRHIHILNLASVQLGIIGRSKLLTVIAKLCKTPGANLMSQRVLYRVLKTYLPREISKCYRTMFPQYIVRPALINYGMNKKEDFTEAELNLYNDKYMFERAQQDFMVKMINLVTGRAASRIRLENTFATTTKPTLKDQIEKENREINQQGQVAPTQNAKPTLGPATGKTSTQTKPESEEPDGF